MYREREKKEEAKERDSMNEEANAKGRRR